MHRQLIEASEYIYEEKKSRFIVNLFSVKDEEEVKRQLNDVKKRYRDAAHHCFAYILDKEAQIERYSDDKEPSGTAGQPMLQVLRGKDLYQILAVVTRYFGGTKLGTGGLVRSYTKSLQGCLEQAVLAEYALYQWFNVEVEYALSGKLEQVISTLPIVVEETAYGEVVVWSLVSLLDDEARCKAIFIDELKGQCQILDIKKDKGYRIGNKIVVG